MYINYGDKDFFQYGCLVDAEHSDTEFDMLVCRPYDDEEDKFQFAQITVDITDTWIDKKAVMSYIGMTEKTFDPIQYAIGCADYYGWENFGAGSMYSIDWTNVSRKEIEDILKHYLIASDNLDITW